MSLITLENVAKVFGSNARQALALSQDGVPPEEIRARLGAMVALSKTSLEIDTGEVFVVMGLSGSGKSTLLRLINRLLDPSAGRVLIDGEDLAPLSQDALRSLRQKRLAMVFQSFALLPHRSVTDNIAFGLDLQGMDSTEQANTATDWLNRVGLKGFDGAFPHELSGGMKQRVGLARALATGADILLMDEPFSALDPLIRREMQDLLLNLQKDLGRTIVFVTHDLAEAIKLGTRIAILRDGSLVQTGAGDDILDHPADDYVRAFTEDFRTTRR